MPTLITEYRGYYLYFYSYDHPGFPDEEGYATPSLPDFTETLQALKDIIDVILDEPLPDELIEVYRDVEIWWKPSLDMFWAQVAVGYVALWATLEDMYASIDEILEFLTPPEEPEEGLLAQAIVAVQTWFLLIIGDYLVPIGDYVDNLFTGAKDAAEDLFAGASEIIAGVSKALTELATEVGGRWDTFTDETLPLIWETLATQASDLQDTIDQNGSDIADAMATGFVDFAAWVEELLGALDPQGVLKDPPGYIGGIFGLLIEPWAEGIMKSFGEGLEEGLEE